MSEPPTDRSVAVVGLGLIGSRLARRFIDHGLEVSGFDIDPDRRDELRRMGGKPATSPADAVSGQARAILSLPDSDVSRRVCLGPEGVADSVSAGLYVYDTTTGRPADAVEIAGALEPAGIVYSDTTLSGNSALAEKGELLVMMGGSVAAYRRGVPLFEAIARSHHHVGRTGAGFRMKLIVNHVLAVHRLALAEGLLAAELAGMDLESTLAVLKDSLAYSRAMDSWGRQMVSGQHEPPASRLRQGWKDARLIVEQATESGAPHELISVVEAVLAEGAEAGIEDLDNSAVIEVLRRRVGRGRYLH